MAWWRSVLFPYAMLCNFLMPPSHTCDVKATEKSRMTADTTDSVSCTQKLIQP